MSTRIDRYNNEEDYKKGDKFAGGFPLLEVLSLILLLIAYYLASKFK